MKPLSIHLQGFASHIDTHLDLTKYRSPIALLGKMECGKTALIEGGIFLMLFGRGLFYCVSIYKFMTQGGTGRAFGMLKFSHKDGIYRIERKLTNTGKTQTQTAFLYREGVDKPIAGPKISDFDRAIYVLVGDAEIAAATWFLSQNRLHDLVGTPGDPNLKAHRRELMHFFLGATEIGAYCKKATAALNDVEGRADEIDAQLDDVPDFGAEIRMQEEGAHAGREARHGCEGNIKLGEDSLYAAREVLAQLDAGDTHHRAAIERYELARSKAKDASKAVVDLSAEIERLEGLAARGETARADLATLGGLKAQREEMHGEVAKWDAWSMWDVRAQGLASSERIAGHRQKKAEDVYVEVDDETRALAEQANGIKDEYRRARDANQAAQAVNNKRFAERQEVRDAAALLNHQILEFSRQIEAKPKIPCGFDLSIVCPLAAEFNALDSKLAQAENKAVEQLEKLEGIPADEPLIDLDEITQRSHAAVEASTKVFAADTADKLIAEGKTLLAAALAAAQYHASNEPPQPATGNPADALQQIQTAIDDLAGAQERLEQAERAGVDLCTKHYKSAVIVEEAKESEVAAEGLKTAADSARLALENQAAERARLQGEIDAENLELERLKTELTRLAEAVGHHAGQIKTLGAQARETAGKRERLIQLRSDAAALEDVKKCFSSQGVRQILIDDAVPDLENIANQLFKIATDGQKQLRIATQRQGTAGHLIEDFAIMVRDGRGEREVIGGYSGGALELIRIIMRIAVIVWQGNIRGERPESLILDEAFDNLGDEFPQLLKVLDSLGRQYKMIIAVTHDPYIANQMPSKIMLDWSISGTRILEGAA